MDRLRRVRALVALLLLLAAAAPAAEKPSLVVVLSVDQMRADYLERFAPFFSADGLKRFLRRGAVFRQARHRHAVSVTGPGHASIGSGLDPRGHGIVANDWLDPARGVAVYCAEDRGADWVGVPPGAAKPKRAGRSPVLASGAFLGDRLKERFPASRVAGVAWKDRSAILMAGHKADAALWFDESLRRFLTSTYYPPHPELLAFNERVDRFLASRKRWDVSKRIPPDRLAAVTFDPPEAASAKEDPAGMGRAFPHPLPSARAVANSPAADELVLELARFVVSRWSLGSRPQAPDLLFVGLSATDYVGHAFGPDSREMAEQIVRLDASLDAFFRWLDATVGPSRVLVFLTADHGVTPIPEVARARAAAGGKPADVGRADLDDGSPGRAALERRLAERLGPRSDPKAEAPEPAVRAFIEPYLYLNRRLLSDRGFSVERARREARDFVAGLPGVAAAYTSTDIADGLPASAPFAAEVARSFRPDRSGDVYVVLRPGWIWGSGTSGTSHGQPSDDDLRVPLAVWGPGVRTGVSDAPVSPLAIAKTVGALFEFEAGAPDVEPLSPVVEARPAAAAAAY